MGDIMKRAVICALCVLTLAGCADKNGNSAETVSETDETSADLVTTEAEESASEGLRADYHDGRIEVTLKSTGETVQVIEDRTFNDDTVLLYRDYDFDGFTDIVAKPKYSGTGGRFYRYDPDGCRFTEWSVLNELNEKHTIDIGGDVLIVGYYTVYKDTKADYVWDGSELYETDRTETYGSVSPRASVTDWFVTGSDGKRILIRRQYTNIDNGAKFRTINYPVYFRTDNENVYIMRNEEVLQTIGGCRLSELAEEYNALDSPGKVFCDEDSLLSECDFDFDGDNDLFIADRYEVGKGFCGRYFRCDGEKFTEWDELNSIGAILRQDWNGEEQLYLMTSSDNYYYEWHDDKLIMTVHDRSETDSDGGHIVYTYKTDDSGREKLVSKIHHKRGGIVDFYEYNEDGSEVLVKSEGE